MKSEGRLEAEVKRVHLGSGVGLSTETSAEAAPSSSVDLDELRSGFREEISAGSGILRSEIETLKGLTVRTFKRRLDSLVVEELPAIFEDFKNDKFTLLWRGSRDGFEAKEFHRRCDGHGNTVTVILDTNGNIFGGFTPVKWESSKKGKGKADPSLKSFLFTVKNPHNFPARRFALKVEKKDEAINCNSKRGPDFDDMSVEDDCTTNADRVTGKFGSTYTNDTGLDEEIFFTGSQHFQVKEIEVFEISGSQALKGWTLGVPSRQLESRVFWDFPAIFEDFSHERFVLVWRGSRDGFEAKELHGRCDGRAKTLTVILDTNGNIFGGFTPVEWDSTAGWKADPSLTRFLFTVKNQLNFPARRFALKAEKKDEAINGDSKRAPDFSDMTVQDKCTTNADRVTGKFGSTCTNDTGLDEEISFTGSKNFQVKEIEVFEISGSHAVKGWTLAVPARKVESRPFCDFPAIFEEFREQKCTLLRG
jgi:hypothetical protein